MKKVKKTLFFLLMLAAILIMSVGVPFLYAAEKLDDEHPLDKEEEW